MSKSCCVIVMIYYVTVSDTSTYSVETVNYRYDGLKNLWRSWNVVRLLYFTVFLCELLASPVPYSFLALQTRWLGSVNIFLGFILVFIDGVFCGRDT